MIFVHQFRAFRNSDPPLVAAIWCSQRPQRGLAQPMSAAQLEQAVFSKLHFDRHGLIVATHGDLPCGFAHAGFGPTADETGVSTEVGVVSMLMVHSAVEQRGDAAALAAELLARSEAYLAERGARVFFGGGIRPLDPFYLGLYGGSELPGILESDVPAQAIYRAASYEEVDRVVVMQCDLTRIRPITNRTQIALRRQLEVRVTPDPPPETWWQASTIGGFDRTRFDLLPRGGGGAALATVTIWRIEPIALTWGLTAAGLIGLSVESRRRQGLATYLLGETFRQLRAGGLTLVEAQIREENTAALGLYQRLGFAEVDRGSVFRKETTWLPPS